MVPSTESQSNADGIKKTKIMVWDSTNSVWKEITSTFPLPVDVKYVSPAATEVSPTNFSKTTAVPLTAEPLVAAETNVRYAYIQAKFTNTDAVYIGSSAVTPATGMVLYAGDVMVIQNHPEYYTDLANWYLDVVVAAEGVQVVYMN